jgi:hypothetical protein
MTLCRRFVLLVSIAFWQGGFMFYGGVVVPTGAAVLGSEVEQGFITQSVTNYLNLAGGFCAALWAITIWLDARSPILRRACWALWFFVAAALGVLIGLHVQMDRLLIVADRVISDESRFRALHQAYLTLISAQWAVCLLLLLATLQAWRTIDADRSRPRLLSPDNARESSSAESGGSTPPARRSFIAAAVADRKIFAWHAVRRTRRRMRLQRNRPRKKMASWHLALRRQRHPPNFSPKAGGILQPGSEPSAGPGLRSPRIQQEA